MIPHIPAVTRADITNDKPTRRGRRLGVAGERTFARRSHYESEEITGFTDKLVPLSPYFSEDQQKQAEYHIVETDGDFHLHNHIGEKLTTPDNSIFVITEDDRMIIGQKDRGEAPIFRNGILDARHATHHTTIAGKKDAKYAGCISVQDGKITSIDLKSGHYQVPEILLPLLCRKLIKVMGEAVRVKNYRTMRQEFMALRARHADKEDVLALLDTPNKTPREKFW